MEKKILSITNEILGLDVFNLYMYYSYIETYGKNIMLRVFANILKQCKDDDDMFYKYFDAFFSIELDDTNITKNSYAILTKKYGEDRINDYFINLLEMNNDSDELINKYKFIYSHINTDNEAYLHDDAVKAYLSSIKPGILTNEEEKEYFLTMNNCRNTIEIATFDDIDNIIFNDIDKVISSISSLEQLKLLSRIKMGMPVDDRKKVESVYAELRNYFRNNKTLVTENKDVYNDEYLDEQLLKISEFVKIRQLVIEYNLKLVVSIAKTFKSSTLTFLDFIQEGNIGLMKAIKKFDVSKGNRLSTYATWWIRQSMQRSINDLEKLIRVPVHTEEKGYKINKATKILEEKYGYTPTNEEIANYLQTTEEDIEFVKKSISTSSTLSLNSYVNNDDDDTSELEDFVAADTPDVCDQIINNTLKNVCNVALNQLTDRERFVVIHRFGFDPERAKTLEEVGQMLGITRERVRQIENKAIKKLRHPVRRKLFEGYY